MPCAKSRPLCSRSAESDSDQLIHDGLLALHPTRSLAIDANFILAGPIWSQCGECVRVATQQVGQAGNVAHGIRTTQPRCIDFQYARGFHLPPAQNYLQEATGGSGSNSRRESGDDSALFINRSSSESHASMAWCSELHWTDGWASPDSISSYDRWKL